MKMGLGLVLEVVVWITSMHLSFSYFSQLPVKQHYCSYYIQQDVHVLPLTDLRRVE